MRTADPSDWWPEDSLARHPIREVFVCDRHLHPPLFSHVVPFSRLELPLNGSYENQIARNGAVETIRLEPGSALFAGPNCWNFPRWQPNVEVMSLLFGKRQLGISIVSANGPQASQLVANKFAVPTPVTGPIPPILEAMLQLHSAQGPSDALAELARALIHCVQRLVQESPGPDRQGHGQGFFERVCLYLQGNYQNEVSRDSVARQFGVSPNHLSRVFHRHGHMRFIDYLTHVRIGRAKYLLCHFNLKLEDIAIRSGFRDAPYLCRVFKRLTRSTPLEYRAKMHHSTLRAKTGEPWGRVELPIVGRVAECNGAGQLLCVE